MDGFSFTGQSDYMDYEDFAALPDTPDFFRSIGVTFIKDGVTVETVEVPFGGRIASVPAVADEDGMYWQWNDFDPKEAVYYSRTVEGEYIRPVTTISTGEDEPLFLAEGTFRDGQTLLAVPFADAETLGIDAASILAAYTVRVSGYSEPLTVRMLTLVSGSLYALSEGTLTPLSFTRDGSYIVFRLDNGASIVYLAQETSRTGWIIGGIAGGAAAAAAVYLLSCEKKKKALNKFWILFPLYAYMYSLRWYCCLHNLAGEAYFVKQKGEMRVELLHWAESVLKYLVQFGIILLEGTGAVILLFSGVKSVVRLQKSAACTALHGAGHCARAASSSAVSRTVIVREWSEFVPVRSFSSTRL